MASSAGVIACLPPELDIFSRSRIQNAIHGSQVVELKPVSALSRPLSVLEFHSSGSTDLYRDLFHTYLRLKVCLRSEDGGAILLPDPGIGVVNNLLYSLFQTFEVIVNGKVVLRIDNFGFCTFVSDLLNFTPLAANGPMTSALFYLDTPAEVNTAGEANLGYKERHERLSMGKICELYGRLKGGIFNQSLLLPSGLDIRVRLTFAPESFYMWNDTPNRDVRLHVQDASLFVKHVSINPSVLIAHAKILAQTNAIFPFKRTEVKSYTIPPGGRSLALNSVCNGKLPSFLCFTMVDNLAYNGDVTKNPFALIHKSITHLSIFVDAVEHRIGPMDFHSTTPYFTCAYHTLFSTFGLDSKSVPHMITPSMFEHGSFLICKDLSADGSGNVAHTNLAKNGELRIEAAFANEIDSAITCLVLLEYDAVMEIDQARNIILS